MTSEERAWLAGLLEGEGCFGAFTKCGPRPQLIVRLNMTDKDVVERAASLMRATLNSFSPPQKNHQTLYIACCRGLQAEDVMRTVRPLMGERRKKKIDEALATPDLSHYPQIEARYRTHKTCRGPCGLRQPLENFRQDSRATDGHTAWCRPCSNKRDQRRRMVKRSTSTKERFDGNTAGLDSREARGS